MKENIPLAPLTTFKIGGHARYFFSIKNIEELKNAVSFGKENNLPIFILGGGSNILVSDDGFAGVVIKIENDNWSVEENESSFLVSADAGLVWDNLIEELILKNINGLENLSLIPGNVSGAIVQNIGAYGVELEVFVKSVEVFDTNKMVVRIFEKENCKFSYRNSIFKKNKNLIVLKAVFEFAKDQESNISYKDLSQFFEGVEDINSKKVRKAVIKIRSEKLPDYRVVGTAGSYFKNPVIDKEKLSLLLDKYPELPVFPQSADLVKISAAFLIDKVAGLKDFYLGKAYTHKRQALVLCSQKGGSAKEVLVLADKIKKDVFEKTGVSLKEEVEYIS